MPSRSQPKGVDPSVGDVTIAPGPVEIFSASFTRADQPTSSEPYTTPIDVRFDLAADRRDETTVVVQLQVQVENPTVMTAEVTARCAIQVQPVEGVEVDVDAEMAKVAGSVGPVVIYPYVRELIADMSRRGGLTPLTLPVYQMGRFFTFEPQDLRLKQEEAEAPAEPTAKSSSKKSKSKAKK